MRAPLWIHSIMTVVWAIVAAVPAGADEDLTAAVKAWLAGPHGQYRAPAFTHWNEEGAVPQNCAACHSETGMLDWLGAEGSAAGVVDHPATINTVIGCASCHVEEAEALDAVTFPSGETIAALGVNATCSVCHQGRASTDRVSTATADLPPDAVAEGLGFVNIHFGVAAAIMQGSAVRGGFEYDGERYAGRFSHVPGADTCVACHEPHSTEVAIEGCLTCHQGVNDIQDIRTRHGDFDGDGQSDGGIKTEIEGLHAILYAGLQRYAQEITDTPIGYADQFPYFFADTNGNGTIDADEARFPNRYAAWTPRLLKAAYNYQVVAKDKGAWVHNPGYALQLLHDSVISLNEVVAVAPAGLARR